MANLRKGSTVGGYTIITENDNNDHFHHVSEIDGLGSAATAETGPGSDFDADTLNGLEYVDIENNLVNISGDTIDSDVRITGTIPDNDLNAINREYVLNFIQNETISESDTIPFVTISPSVSLTYDDTNDIVSLSSGDILIGGQYFSFTTLSSNVTPSANTTLYIYVVLSSGTLSLSVEANPISHDFRTIMVGTLSFDGSTVGVISQRVSMTNLGSHSVSTQAIPYSAILSDGTGKIDSDWFDISFSDSIDTVTLKGNTSVSSNGSVVYTITDYDQLSSYTASVNIGSLSISGNTITYNAPSTTDALTATLSVTRNSTTLRFRIEVTP